MLKKSCLSGILFFMLSPFFVAGQDTVAWKMQPVSIQTRWAKHVSPSNPQREYPRPQMRRSNWQTLDGLWAYKITAKDEREPEFSQDSILVPFPLESALSGVKKALLPSQCIWYKRKFHFRPSGRNLKTLIHFGAVDWQATVFINGKNIGTHNGGYTSFSFDITDYLKIGTNDIVVRVYDPSDQGIGPHGKQVLNPGSIYYTASSGIWQTVWLEQVPPLYISDLKMTPDINNQRVNVKVITDGNAMPDSMRFTASIGTAIVTSNSVRRDGQVSIDIPNAKLWTPESPFLYDLKVELIKGGVVIDTIRSYFGMRSVSISKDSDQSYKIFLNNRPYFNMGILDQGFWPDGLYSSPTDSALLFDILAIKAMGFNTIRKHIKVEPAKWYYYADREGVLVWQDFVNPNQALPDGARSEFERGVAETVSQLYNHPSVISWVVFNERWGAYDQREVANMVRQLDSTRIVNAHSGEYLYVDNALREKSDRPYDGSDVSDVHSYPAPRDAVHIDGKARVVGEFGGLGVSIFDHTWNSSNWGYEQLEGDSLLFRYRQLVNDIKLLKDSGLSGCIYTQPFDVEGEVNGLITYDRSVIKVPLDELRKINSALWNSNSVHSFVVDLNNNLGPDQSETSYKEQVREFFAGRRDSFFLRVLAIGAEKRKNYQFADKVMKIYLDGIQSIYSRESLTLIKQVTKSVSDTGFSIFSNNSKEIDSVLGNGSANDLLDKLISQDLHSLIFSDTTISNIAYSERIATDKFGRQGLKVFLTDLAYNYYINKKYDDFFKVKVRLYREFPTSISPYDMNNDAWTIFEHFSDREKLETAMEWSKKSIELDPNTNHYDTYANILYKLGNRHQAIKTLEKGLSINVFKGPKEDMLKNLEKMRGGQKTW